MMITATPRYRVQQLKLRLSFGVLEQFVSREYGPDLEILAGDGDPFGDGRKQTDGRIANITGVSRYSVLRWRHGDVPLITGERVAGAMGVHPWDVWNDEYYADLAALNFVSWLVGQPLTCHQEEL